MKADLIDSMGTDLSVVNAARVSFDKVSKEFKDQDAKLIMYLAKHKHRSPFNHAFLSFRVKAPIFVARQLQKHEYLTWNEVSRRYVDTKPEFYSPKMWRKRATDKKQGSLSEPVDEPLMNKFSYQRTTEEMYQKTLDNCIDLYNEMLYNGTAPEQARMVLPQSMYTEWIWSGSLGAFCKMLNLRLDSHTQEETREIAAQIADQMEPLFPVSMKALREYPIL